MMNKIINPVVKDRLRRLNPGKDEKELLKEYYRKKLRLAAIVLLAGLCMGILLFINEKKNALLSETGEILREDQEGQNLKVPVTVYTEQYGEVDIDIEVKKQSYSQEELEEIFAEAKGWLAQTMVGQNKGLDCVRERLVFPETYKETDIEISYSSSNYGLIRESGEVRNEELKKEETVSITAELCYGDRVQAYEYTVVVYPPQLTKEEQFQKILMEIIKAEDDRQKENDRLILPTHIGEELVQYRKKGSQSPIYMILCSILCAALLYKGMDRDLDKFYEERQRKLRFAYPEFVSGLALLVGAGMSVTGAIRRIYEDKKQKTKAPLYEELGIFVRNLDNGVLEERALEDFGKRCGLVSYRKFCSLLSIHMKKGSVNLQKMLEKEAEEAFEAHQLQIRQLGEEAGTKLLLPMIMMLAVVMAIIMIPAFLSYQIT